MTEKRDIRLSVFLNREERDLIQSVTPDDVSVGATIRRLALKQAQWYAENGKKPRGTTRSQAAAEPPNSIRQDTYNAQYSPYDD